MRLFLFGTLAILSAAGLWAQPLYVYSEFARIDAKGKVAAPAEPREILSPAIARNAFTSFQVVVEAPEAKAWWLFIGQNPENSVKVTMYRESAAGKLEPAEVPIPGRGTQVFWMDVWTERTARVQRIKIEPQLNIDDDWVIYPMEARVMDTVVPDGERPPGAIEPGDLMRGFLCGVAGKPVNAEGISPEALRYRNARQDLSLAPKAPREALQKLFGACDAKFPADNPEWYLKIRDYLFRMQP